MVHIGRSVSQFAFSSRRQMVTASGEIAFRVALENLDSCPLRTVQVEIRNLRKAEE